MMDNSSAIVRGTPPFPDDNDGNDDDDSDNNADIKGGSAVALPSTSATQLHCKERERTRWF